jgi:hypothetical protein
MAVTGPYPSEDQIAAAQRAAIDAVDRVAPLVWENWQQDRSAFREEVLDGFERARPYIVKYMQNPEGSKWETLATYGSLMVLCPLILWVYEDLGTMSILMLLTVGAACIAAVSITVSVGLLAHRVMSATRWGLDKAQITALRILVVTLALTGLVSLKIHGLHNAFLLSALAGVLFAAAFSLQDSLEEAVELWALRRKLYKPVGAQTLLLIELTIAAAIIASDYEEEPDGRRREDQTEGNPSVRTNLGEEADLGLLEVWAPKTPRDAVDIQLESASQLCLPAMRELPDERPAIRRGNLRTGLKMKRFFELQRRRIASDDDEQALEEVLLNVMRAPIAYATGNWQYIMLKSEQGTGASTTIHINGRALIFGGISLAAAAVVFMASSALPFNERLVQATPLALGGLTMLGLLKESEAAGMEKAARAVIPSSGPSS